MRTNHICDLALTGRPHVWNWNELQPPYLSKKTSTTFWPVARTETLRLAVFKILKIQKHSEIDENLYGTMIWQDWAVVKKLPFSECLGCHCLLQTRASHMNDHGFGMEHVRVEGKHGISFVGCHCFLFYKTQTASPVAC